MVSHAQPVGAARPLLTLDRVTHHRVAGLGAARCVARVLDRVTLRLAQGDLLVVRTADVHGGAALLRLLAGEVEQPVERRHVALDLRTRRRRVAPGTLPALIEAWRPARTTGGQATTRSTPGPPSRLWLLHERSSGGASYPLRRRIARWARRAGRRGDAVVVVTSAVMPASRRSGDRQATGRRHARVVREANGATPDRSDAAPQDVRTGDVRWYALVAGRLLSDLPPPDGSSAPPWRPASNPGATRWPGSSRHGAAG
jgi:hypothetical protein